VHKMWNIDTLLKIIRRAGTIDRQPGSCRLRSVCVNENTENVEAEMEPGLRVTGQSSDPDFDPGSCSMPISHTLYSSTEFGY